MPEAIPIRQPKDVIEPDPTLVPFTCPWAQDGLRKALEGLGPTSAGVQSYGIGSRQLTYRSVSEQTEVIAYWNSMVEYYCGVVALPASLLGQDTACRIIPRDV
jgi:hypothetical protein